MKKIVLTMVCAGAMMVSAFAQLLDEKNVTITMDLQPVLQLSLQGPDQIDFTFDDINEYYSGITKYGANILRVSASVSFDLWAAGLSQQATQIWDNPVAYAGGGASGLTTIPITALELRQFPANPTIGAACAIVPTVDDNYSVAFVAYDPAVAPSGGLVGNGNNCIYAPLSSTPYDGPTDAAGTASEKYIAGGDGTAIGCAVAGGSYLMEALAGGIPSAAGYYFVMDYRILPGLPAVFPAALTTEEANATSPTLVAADAAAGTLGSVANIYAAPGVYTMYIKYILVEDQ